MLNEAYKSHSTRRTRLGYICGLIAIGAVAIPQLSSASRISQPTARAAQEAHLNATAKVASNKPGKTAGKSAKTSGQKAKKNAKPAMTMEQFLDRLMVAESGGNDLAKNPLSTATGAFQFIESTFLSVMQRHFPKRIEKLTTAQILQLRTDRKVARDAARAFTRDNATRLVAAGHKSTFPHLRLAFLLGTGGAIRVLSAKPATPVSSLLSRVVIRANPWMRRHTAASLIARSAREVALPTTTQAGVAPRRDKKTGELLLPKAVRKALANRPRIRVRCNLARPSCKRWLSLKRQALRRKGKRRIAENR